jgi:hypothetical protein
MNYLKEIQRRVKEIELLRWVYYFLNDALRAKYKSHKVVLSLGKIFFVWQH